jgi:HNH endonuclease
MPKNPIGFQMPTSATITGRSSSITNAFVSAIIPVVFPTEVEVIEALKVLGMSRTDVRCAYCGDPSTEWDHLRPLVVAQKPTGFISEIANLVPSCGKCNQSKGKKDWREWMRSSAPRSPRMRGILDLEARMVRLEAYEQWRQPKRLNFQELVGDDLWIEYWSNWQEVLGQMKKSQACAEKLKAQMAGRT